MQNRQILLLLPHQETAGLAEPTALLSPLACLSHMHVIGQGKENMEAHSPTCTSTGTAIGCAVRALSLAGKLGLRPCMDSRLMNWSTVGGIWNAGPADAGLILRYMLSARGGLSDWVLYLPESFVSIRLPDLADLESSTGLSALQMTQKAELYNSASCMHYQAMAN